MSATDADTIVRLRAAVTRIARRIDRQVSRGGLTSTQLSVLSSVANYGPIGLGELAEVEGVNPTMLSRIVGKLEEGGLIRRHVDQADRRAVRVEITEAGTELRITVVVERTQLITQRLGELSDAEVALLIAAVPALEALAAGLSPKVGVEA